MELHQSPTLKRVYTYFQENHLELFSNAGTLPFTKNILQNDLVDKIVECNGYLGDNVSGRTNFEIDEHCQTHKTNPVL